MNVDEIIKYLNREVIITDVLGEKYSGLLTNTVSKFDSISGNEGVELMAEDSEYGLDYDNITSIEISDIKQEKIKPKKGLADRLDHHARG